jgi:hypothetical protein
MLVTHRIVHTPGETQVRLKDLNDLVSKPVTDVTITSQRAATWQLPFVLCGRHRSKMFSEFFRIV